MKLARLFFSGLFLILILYFCAYGTGVAPALTLQDVGQALRSEIVFFGGNQGG